MAFEFMGDMQRADRTKIETLWVPAERYTIEQKAQAAQQAKGTLPDEAIWTDIYQYPPAEVANLRTLRGRDMLFVRPGAPAPERPAPAPVGEPTT